MTGKKRSEIMNVNTDETICLKRAPNGGWVVTQRAEEPGRIPETVGAFSEVDDLISSLRVALN